MIYLIIGILLIITPFIALIINKQRDTDEPAFIFWGIVFIIVFFIMMILGITTYPRLLSERAACIGYKNAITETAKIYTTTIPVQSISQLTQYASLVATYNSDLQTALTKKKMLTSKIFGSALFISDKIYDLDFIGGANVNSRGN